MRFLAIDASGVQLPSGTPGRTASWPTDNLYSAISYVMFPARAWVPKDRQRLHRCFPKGCGPLSSVADVNAFFRWTVQMPVLFAMHALVLGFGLGQNDRYMGVLRAVGGSRGRATDAGYRG